MNYPINISFKLLALASQLYITDAAGNTLGYAKQKLLKLKEDIRIFSDESQTTELYQIKADRVIDFSPRYNFYDSRTGNQLGSIKRRGMRSLWSAHYDVFLGETVVMTISEENAMVKVIDALVGEIPIVGMFTGYVFNPAYLVSRSDKTVIARLKKQPALLQSEFQLTEQAQMADAEEDLVLLSVLTMTLLERQRG